MIFIITALIALIIASYTDIKTREVPDWLNYSLIVFGLGARLIFSLASNDFSFILHGIYGFAAFLILAYAMYYLGQWGGGDSKMLMGLGAVIGLELSSSSLLVPFLVNIFLIGAIYGLLYSTVLALLNRKEFVREFVRLKKQVLKYRKYLLIIMMLLLLSLIFTRDLFLKVMILALLIILPATFYLWIYIKVIEKVAMLKYVTPSELTEGDWIAKEVKVNGKLICGPRDLGIEKEQIAKLKQFYRKGKVKKVLVKYGIPFVPSFLLALIATLLGLNPIFFIL
jgi:Flp pilus assembly protein protease CpaA